MKDFDFIFDQIDAAVAPERFTNSLEFGKILDEKGACSALMFRPEYSTEPLFASIKEPTLMEFDLGENGVYLSSDRKHCLYIKNQQIILMESTVVPETINYVKRKARIGAAIGATGGGFMGSIIGRGLGAGIGALSGLIRGNKDVETPLMVLSYWDEKQIVEHHVLLQFNPKEFNAERFLEIWKLHKTEL